MKNAIKSSFLAAIAVCFFAFTNTVTAAALPKSGNAAINPAPVGGAYLVFAGKTGGKIAKKDFEGQTRLAMNGCPGASESTIVSFKLEINKGGKLTTLEAKGGKLSTEMVNKLKSLASGDTFEFKKVMAHFPNSKDTYEVHTQKFIVA